MIISNYMKNDHRECDTLFSKAEEAIARGEWEVQVNVVFSHKWI